MDVEQLHIVLQQSFSADANVRKPAEETIRNLKNLPGSVQLLLQVAAEKQVRFVFLVIIVIIFWGFFFLLAFFVNQSFPEKSDRYDCS
jgi:hypothetical protein